MSDDIETANILARIGAGMMDVWSPLQLVYYRVYHPELADAYERQRAADNALYLRGLTNGLPTDVARRAVAAPGGVGAIAANLGYNLRGEAVGGLLGLPKIQSYFEQLPDKDKPRAVQQLVDPWAGWGLVGMSVPSWYPGGS